MSDSPPNMNSPTSFVPDSDSSHYVSLEIRWNTEESQGSPAMTTLRELSHNNHTFKDVVSDFSIPSPTAQPLHYPENDFSLTARQCLQPKRTNSLPCPNSQTPALKFENLSPIFESKVSLLSSKISSISANLKFLESKKSRIQESSSSTLKSINQLFKSAKANLQKKETKITETILKSHDLYSKNLLSLISELKNLSSDLIGKKTKLEGFIGF